jgi:kinesin family protein 3/17
MEQLGVSSDVNKEPLSIWHSFVFDHVFDQDSTQEAVYVEAAQPAVRSCLDGYNATILAYGQTGTGKTHTMEGFKFSADDEARGIIPRCIEEIFS